MKKIAIVMMMLVMGIATQAKEFVLKSPDGRLVTQVQVGDKLAFNLFSDGQQLLGWSQCKVEVVGQEAKSFFCPTANKFKSAKTASVDREILSPFTRQESMKDHYNALTLRFSGSWAVEFRAYNEGLAYRILYEGRDTLMVNEHCLIDVQQDREVRAPYVISYKQGDRSVQYATSFENRYTRGPMSQLNSDRNCFLPLLVSYPQGKKLCFGESHLEDFPGLYLHTDATQTGLFVGDHAPYPTRLEQGGHNNLQMLVKGAANYQARIQGARPFPWRIMMVSSDDTELAANNMTYLLGAPSRVADLSWIRPGKVAWDWWNDWNIQGVDFLSGINNDTYKYYIDFAANHGVEYVILDEGWAVNNQCDLFQVVPAIDLPMLVRYADERGVGIILWAGYWAFHRDMERVCKHYSEMGVKGFKVDFMDRDDQPMTDFYYRAADMAARYHLVIDFHGAFKPAGLNRTYPNVLNFEGVAGLEQLKWAPEGWDQVVYDCELPFIRQTAGPMDYTQGAMINAAKGHYNRSWSEPMSMGTRCRQLALYVVFESPLDMMCDSPSNYEKEEECAKMIASVPTVWDETRVLEGRVGEYIIVARRSGKDWYIGGITNWEERDITLSLRDYRYNKLILFQDGKNAHRKGSDYKRVESPYVESQTIHLAPGGGFLIKLEH